MWNRSDLVEVLCCYWQSGFFFKDFRGAAGPCLFSFLPCFQYVDNKARLGGAWNICPTSKPLQRASSPPLALCSELLWFIQFFSRVSAARLIGIPSNPFPNLNIPMKHRQIGGQSVRSALHKRFSITVWCLLLGRKLCWCQQSRDLSKGSGSTNVCQELLRSTHRWIMNAPFYLLTFKTWIQMPLPLNISIAIYPGCAKTQESICLKSSIDQLLMWTSGLLFSEERRLSTTSQAVCNILRGGTAFRQDEDNVESFSSSGSIMMLRVSTPGFVQRTPLVNQFFSSVSAARLIGIPSSLFSESQYLEKA